MSSTPPPSGVMRVWDIPQIVEACTMRACISAGIWQASSTTAAVETAGVRDLERYMRLVGAEVRMPLGEPWRAEKRPYGHAALSTTAACLKGVYLHEAALGVVFYR